MPFFDGYFIENITIEGTIASRNTADDLEIEMNNKDAYLYHGK